MKRKLPRYDIFVVLIDELSDCKNSRKSNKTAYDDFSNEDGHDVYLFSLPFEGKCDQPLRLAQ
jgi:hypothetical protein